jgi:hypothetical protein
MSDLTSKPNQQGVHTRDPSKHQKSPKDLLRESPPPDPKDGLTVPEVTSILEDASRVERRTDATARANPSGVIDGPRVPGGNKCGARYGRCFGQVVNGKCQSCGYVYGQPSALGGVNSPAEARTFPSGVTRL